ncbi:Alpha/Beta hydrolase protein, partial [Neohortaea acidophila]
DHALGRPDVRYRKYQIFAVVAVWSALVYAKPHGPKPVSRLSRFLSTRITTWQALVLTCLAEYLRRDFKKLVPWLESPEPLADMYNRDYFRATWITTALDAGFWTAMRIRPAWLRDFASVLFAGYYLVCADQADEMVRKVRGKLSLEHLRVSWNKGTTPYLSFMSRLMRPPRLKMRYRPRKIRIPRSSESPYKDPVHAWLYYDGPLGELKNHDKIILDIPGGGFVAMNPRCYDDKLMAWAVKTGFPVVSLDYKKAPEYPYPYALNECFDAYYSIVSSHGKLIGLPGDSVPKIILTGDSAGGNLAVGTVLMMLQGRDRADRRNSRTLPLPEALILVYPALDVNMSSWLTDEQSALIKDPTRRKANKAVVKRLDGDYRSMINTPMPSDDELDEQDIRMSKVKRSKSSGKQKLPMRTRLEMTSMISYVDDRVLSPEMLRAMVILYLGENVRPDFSTEYLLSPLRAPEELLREFPKVYMLTGERDPLSDDTVIFAGRLLEAQLHKFQARKEAGLILEDAEFVDSDYVYYELVPGVSHGFLQIAPVYARGFRLIETCSTWMKTVFE